MDIADEVEQEEYYDVEAHLCEATYSGNGGTQHQGVAANPCEGGTKRHCEATNRFTKKKARKKKEQRMGPQPRAALATVLIV